MGRRKEFKVAKSFTITVKNIAWLEEQCYETGEKASVDILSVNVFGVLVTPIFGIYSPPVAL